MNPGHEHLYTGQMTVLWYYVPIMKNFCSLVLWLSLGLAGARTAEAPDDYSAAVHARFRPAKPTVRMNYSVTYRLLGMELKHLAMASVTATEGQWPAPDGGAPQPACLVEFNLHTGDGQTQRGMVQISNRITAVLTMPDLNAVVFIKRSKQRINMLYRRKRLDNLEVYNLENGSLDYLRHDYQAGTISTNLVGAEDLTRQGKEVSRFLRVLHANYHNAEALADFNPDTPVYIYTEGNLVPFMLLFHPQRDQVSALDDSIPALYFTAVPHPDADGRGRNFEMWTASFLDVSQRTHCQELIDLAQHTLPWSMVPLRTDLGLPLGAIRCHLTGIEVIPDPRTQTVLIGSLMPAGS
ncbi:MAG: hypothetical protein ABR497_03435 [Kiritimatiellia bacterium]|nr:hypothetical protein [Lentisphaerota bacterium]